MSKEKYFRKKNQFHTFIKIFLINWGYSQILSIPDIDSSRSSGRPIIWIRFRPKKVNLGMIHIRPSPNLQKISQIFYTNQWFHVWWVKHSVTIFAAARRWCVTPAQWSKGVSKLFLSYWHFWKAWYLIRMECVLVFLFLAILPKIFQVFWHSICSFYEKLQLKHVFM